MQKYVLVLILAYCSALTENKKVDPGAATSNHFSRILASKPQFYRSELINILKERLNSSMNLVLIRKLCETPENYASAQKIMQRYKPRGRKISHRYSFFKKFHDGKTKGK